MAVVGNSYLYHMREDLVANIEPGVAQHMGENALGLITHLTSADSSLPSLATSYSPPTTVYFTYLGGWFIHYSFKTAKIMYTALLILAVALAKATSKKDVDWAVGSVVLGVLGSIAGPNIVAVLMRNVLDKSLSWFSSPFAPVALYAPPCLLGVSHHFSCSIFTEPML